MNINGFLSRINRGIALGLLVLITVAVWFLMSTIQFNRQLDTVKSFISDYVDALEPLNMVITTGYESEMRAHVDGFISNFFVTYSRNISSPLRFMGSKSFVTQQLEELMHPDTGRIASVSFTLREIHTIQQVATSAAEVSFTISLEGVTYNASRVFDGTFNNRPPNYAGEDDIAMGWAGSGNFDALLYRINGEWRIVHMHGLIPLIPLGVRRVPHG